MEHKTIKRNKRNIQHPLFAISPKHWLQILEINGGFDIQYLDRAAFITIGSLITTPARLYFKFRYQTQIEKTTIKYPPIIILGHWRSGTTYLHELLCQNPDYCYVSLWNTLFPVCFPLFEPMKEILSHFLPKTRPMDNIEVDINGPYEEEAGIAVLSPWSFFHCLHFPKNAEEQYLKAIHHKGLSEKEIKDWQTMYLQFMKTVLYIQQEKRLCIKDPANTARIPLLLNLFPDAKFIHIYRNPYNVYASTIQMRNRVLEKLSLQQGNPQEIQTQVLENYKRLMTTYFTQQHLIPKQNLIEIRYEDLVQNPLEQVKTIYQKLKLPGFKKAKPYLKNYLERKKDYKTNTYTYNTKLINLVQNHWSFTLKKWGYQPPNQS